VNLGSKAGGRRTISIVAAMSAAAIALAGCGEKAEPEVRPPTTATPTVTAPTAPPDATTPTQPAPTTTQP
jgi:hypothetical protein